MRLYVVALALVGCAQQTSPVKGRYVYRYPDGTTVPVDMSGETFQILVAKGTSFDAYPDAPIPGNADGTFEIADVPEGPYLLRQAVPDWFGTFQTGTDHDFVEPFDVLGRPDAVPAMRATPLQIDAAGLAPWQAGDQLYVGCFGNATEITGPHLTPSLLTDMTTIDASFDWATASSWGIANRPYLMDPSAGDQLVIAHASARTIGDIQTLALTQTLTTPAPTQSDGQTTSVSGTFQEVALTNSVTVTIPADQLAAEADPVAKPTFGWNVFVGPDTDQQLFLGPELARGTSTVATAPVTTSLMYGNPFDPTWKPYVGAWFEAFRTVSGDPQGPVASLLLTESRPLDGTSYTFEPLSPIAAVTVAGQPIAGDPITVAGDRAVRIDFDEPAETSTARITLWRLDSFGLAAFVDFDRAPIDLPPDIFVSGARYALEIDVYSDDGNGRTRSSGTYTDSFVLVAH